VVYAVLRELGRSGVQALVERSCGLARRFAREVTQIPGAQVLNDVVLNQVLVRLVSATVDNGDALHRAIAAKMQAEGKCWLGTTTWKGQLALRMSICNWMTTEDDIALVLESLGQAVFDISGGSLVSDG
jgi:glutamate/tyrosine decarboxylase-like PLP-dependent enzyme